MQKPNHIPLERSIVVNRCCFVSAKDELRNTALFLKLRFMQPKTDRFILVKIWLVLGLFKTIILNV